MELSLNTLSVLNALVNEATLQVGDADFAQKAALLAKAKAEVAGALRDAVSAQAAAQAAEATVEATPNGTEPVEVRTS